MQLRVPSIKTVKKNTQLLGVESSKEKFIWILSLGYIVVVLITSLCYPLKILYDLLYCQEISKAINSNSIEVKHRPDTQHYSSNSTDCLFILLLSFES